MQRLVWCFSLCCMWSGVAVAHSASPFLLPEMFDIDSDSITLQSAITVEKFFVPSRAFDSSFLVTMPDGSQTELPAAFKFQRFSMLELPTSQKGTYSIRTSNTATSNNDYALIDGRWLRIRPARINKPETAKSDTIKAETSKAAPSNEIGNQTGKMSEKTAEKPRSVLLADVPADAERRSTRVLNVAETYVSKGAPSSTKTQLSGLQLQTSAHPNELFRGETIEVTALYDGKPIPDLEIDVYLGASAQQKDAQREQPSVRTNAEGKAQITPSQAGLYLLATQYPTTGTDLTLPPPEQITLYGLTLEVSP